MLGLIEIVQQDLPESKLIINQNCKIEVANLKELKEKEKWKNFPNIHVSISSEVHPQIREYERASTTTANAYVQPLSSEYIINLSKSLKELGFSGHFHLIQSLQSEKAFRRPIFFLVHLAFSACPDALL